MDQTNGIPQPVLKSPSQLRSPDADPTNDTTAESSPSSGDQTSAGSVSALTLDDKGTVIVQNGSSDPESKRLDSDDIRPRHVQEDHSGEDDNGDPENSDLGPPNEDAKDLIPTKVSSIHRNDRNGEASVQAPNTDIPPLASIRPPDAEEDDSTTHPAVPSDHPALTRPSNPSPLSYPVPASNHPALTRPPNSSPLSYPVSAAPSNHQELARSSEEDTPTTLPTVPSDQPTSARLPTGPSATTHPTVTSEGTEDSSEIPPKEGARGDAEDLRTGNEESESKTSLVNEFALSDTDSPIYEGDRKLEKFSEILLDSDLSHSEGEAQEEEAEGEDVSSPKKKKKNAPKKVRFADEVIGKLEVDGECVNRLGFRSTF